LRRREASDAAAPCTPFPFSTSTFTTERARSGCVGTRGALCLCPTRAGLGAAAADAVADDVACFFGARCTAPMPISAKSSSPAMTPTTSVAVRQGKLAGIDSACCTDRHDSLQPRLLLHDPRPRLGEALVERVPWPPVELALRECDVEHAPPQLAEPCLAVARLALDAGCALDRGVELVHRRLGAGADVDDPAAPELGRREHRLDDVAGVDVVARLAAVAEDRRLAALVQEAHEDRDDARLAVRLLAGPVDVAEAKCDVPRPKEAVPRREVLLGGELRRPVRREGAPLRRLRGGAVALAVDRAAGRREDDTRA